MSEESDRHEDKREVEREIGVSKPDGTEVEVDTEREASHEHETSKKGEDEEDGA